MLTALHVTFVCATLALVLYADHEALSWVRGKRTTLSAKKLEWLHTLTGLGLAGLIATGGLLFLRRPQYLLSDTTFVIKMVFVAALIVNSFVISALSHRATTRPWRELSTRERLPLLISGAISGASWAGAAISGLLL